MTRPTTRSPEAYPKLDDAGRVLALEDDRQRSVLEERSALRQSHGDGSRRRSSITPTIDWCDVGRCGARSRDRGCFGLGQAEGARRQLACIGCPRGCGDQPGAAPSTAKPDLRSEFRAALSHAAHSAAAKQVLADKLADSSVPSLALIHLLRAATSRGSVADDATKSLTKQASPAFARLATPDADFRTRYLLLGPAAQLAKDGDARAAAFVEKAISADPDIHVRARAAEVAGELPSLLDPLGRALDDADPRVRDAACSVGRIVDPKGSKVQPRPWPANLFAGAAKLLVSDPFTYVRGHSADVLLGVPPGDEADRPLDKSLGDLSPVVRARAVEILGRRGALRYADDIRERLDDEEEILDVRVRAARALGRVCDKTSADRLTELAQGTAQPSASGAALVVGASAAAALGRLNPPDLAKRLAPLSSKSAPRIAQEIAKSALTTTDRCR